MGERIYVFGNLSSKPFSLDDGRLRQKLTIKSKYVRLRGHERNQENLKDENNVKILAKISSDIHHAENHSVFTLEISHIPKYDNDKLDLKSHFHLIISNCFFHF